VRVEAWFAICAARSSVAVLQVGDDVGRAKGMIADARNDVGGLALLWIIAAWFSRADRDGSSS
jgi:hypothetical protein